MELMKQIARAWAVARGDVYEEDEIGHVPCPSCWNSGQQVKLLHRLWHRVYLDHKIDCCECDVVYRRRTKLGLIEGFKRWRAATREARAQRM